MQGGHPGAPPHPPLSQRSLHLLARYQQRLAQLFDLRHHCSLRRLLLPCRRHGLHHQARSGHPCSTRQQSNTLACHAGMPHTQQYIMQYGIAAHPCAVEPPHIPMRAPLTLLDMVQGEGMLTGCTVPNVVSTRPLKHFPCAQR
jgi:hypothetical protein